MLVELTCHACGHADRQTNLDGLAIWSCPECKATPEARAAEDFQSALEDALAQLWWLHQTAAVTVTLRSDDIPDDFRPQGPQSVSS